MAQYTIQYVTCSWCSEKYNRVQNLDLELQSWKGPYGSSSPASVREAQWGIELPTPGSTARDLNTKLFSNYTQMKQHVRNWNSWRFCIPWFSHQRIRRLILGRTAIKKLEKIIKCEDVSLETKTKIIHTLVFLVTMYGCESWTVKKKPDSFET